MPNNHPLPQTSESQEAVPVFNLTLYVRTDKTGATNVRIANLEISEYQAGSTRDAIGKIVTEAKKLIGTLMAEDAPVPWIVPPLEIQAGETQFLVPLHL